MSRIGLMPIAIPAGVTVDVAENNTVTVKGPKGTLTRTLPAEMKFEQENGELHVVRPNDQKKEKALHGLTRALVHNMVVGVTDGYTKTLEINGVGYRAQKKGKVLELHLGYSHMSKLSAMTIIPRESYTSICIWLGELCAVRIASHPICLSRCTCRIKADLFEAAPIMPRS